MGAHLPLQCLEPAGGEPLMFVTCGQCDARPTVTFPAARHHRPLADTKLYCLVTETHVLTTCPGLHSIAGRTELKPQHADCKFSVLTTRPLSHTVEVEKEKYLVSAAYLWLTVDVNNASKLHETMMIKHVAYAEMIAVASKIVPLVHIDAVTLICNNLETNHRDN